MLEKYGFFLVVLGLVIGAYAFFRLVVIAFKTRILWGLGVLLFPPLGILFMLRHKRRSLSPILLFILAGVVLALPYAASYYEQHFMEWGPRERIVDKEQHLTLTGWDKSDYSILKDKPEVVVLQMANPDVTDDTLDYIKGMNQLRELDLNDTKVTDKGLAVLADLPKLTELRLARTSITDEGFQKNLLAKESLLKLDLTGTAVKGKTKRDWKKAKEGREYLD
jgi:hypothetical protein